ncbi:uncharacterized protein LOC136082998 [Hydra vulgaris]|uniref:Uncharacterized protein LOC136082998 n=1 Tax=Hydra vulgaris TaxID=6087 RepID=A0ABM4CA02_HYDVU
MTDRFKLEIGLHQGLTQSSFLIAIVMDRQTDKVRLKSPWTMMFADNIVINSESREQVEVNLERWMYALESRVMKVSRSKTKHMCVNERADVGQVQLQGVDLVKVDEFTYLGPRVQSNGGSEREIKKRVQAGWCRWQKVSGVICDRTVSGRMKGKIYMTVVRTAMLYGLDTVTLTKRQVREMEVSEMKMLRFSFG